DAGHALHPAGKVRPGWRQARHLHKPGPQRLQRGFCQQRADVDHLAFAPAPPRHRRRSRRVARGPARADLRLRLRLQNFHPALRPAGAPRQRELPDPLLRMIFP
ncbi:hypothetical protein RZS08_66160, partial [Arthrospira platensis SPKY1]|nr:hypothetical protein [Arthrospira platensis SPKY1]